MMQYALEADSQRLFDTQLHLLKRNFIDSKQRIVWKIAQNNRISAKANSLIDDLRIVGFLIKASQKWHQKSYLQTALRISKAIKKYNLNHSLPVDYYDFQSCKPGFFLTLSYIDLETMHQLAFFDKDWLLIYEHVKQLLMREQNLSVLPVQRYDVVHKVYEKDATINSIDLLLIIEHQIDDGKIPVLLLGWLKRTILQNKRLVNAYSSITQQEATVQESPAVYALSCRIFLKVGDVANAKKLYDHLMSMRIINRKSPFFGGYADIQTKESFSFDNLQALISIRFWNNRIYNKCPIKTE